jgi:MMP alpha-(1->4)-mannosyltransferase
VHNGVDADLFRAVPGEQRVPGRIITTASADVPLKGLPYLIEAVAKLRTERDAELVVVGPQPSRGPVRTALDRYEMHRHVRFTGPVDPLELVAHYAQSEVAVVPSLYEGFSLPAVEAMACAVPLVTTTGGALPEVVGPDGHAALHVPPADAGALAHALGRLLDDGDLRARLGGTGRTRAVQRFGWRASARATVAEYERVLAQC